MDGRDDGSETPPEPRERTRAFASRVVGTGPFVDRVHLVDLFLYESSMFANVGVVEGDGWVGLVDAGTSATTGSILNYLNYLASSGSSRRASRVLIVPTHHHVDHAGGLAPLLRHLARKGQEVEILTTKGMAERLEDPREHEERARATFGPVVGEYRAVPRDRVTEVRAGQRVALDERTTLRVVATPGHCPDHVVPTFELSGEGADVTTVAFAGEALGINLSRHLAPLPASSAPEFDYSDYRRSIDRVKALDADAVAFAHFGGVVGKDAVASACHAAKRGLRDFRKAVLCLRERGLSTREITARVYESYASSLSPLALDPGLTKQLAFTVVYGVLLDDAKRMAGLTTVGEESAAPPPP
ncbi:MAG: hypothetical protein Kow0069_10550 [Promethearchaeota archaeon]